MEITGNLIKILPVTEGEGARGHWVKGQFVLERDDDYRTKVAFITFSNDVLEMLKPLEPGARLTATFTMESREFNGRWYTDLRCHRVAPASQAAAPAVPPQPAEVAPQQPLSYDPLASDDVLPF